MVVRHRVIDLLSLKASSLRIAQISGRGEFVSHRDAKPALVSDAGGSLMLPASSVG